ncbi:MAG: hypothetical protein JKX92_09045 [Porticoccaceae bacterium]|nr:hypothetical protein [Porticoccaceae bacterium]
MLDAVPSVAQVSGKIGDLLRAGVDCIKCYFTMPRAIVRAVIDYVDKRVPVVGHWKSSSKLPVCCTNAADEWLAVAIVVPCRTHRRASELLAEAIRNMVALRAVTSVAAHYLRADVDIGVIVPGRYADFLVLGGDRLRDVKELPNLETTYLGGIAYNHQQLIANATQHEPDGLD